MAKSDKPHDALLPASGATFALPHRDEGELKRVLSDLHVDHVFDLAGVNELYGKLGGIIGKWLSEQERMEVSPVAKALLSTARKLSDVARLMSGFETGLHTSVENFVTSETAKYLALDPTIGSLSKAQEHVSAFQQDAARIAHVCMIAYAGLPDRSGEGGRPALAWYNEFTALLFEIADKAGVVPTLRKDRKTRVRSGWLFEAAQALEPFLYREMRSPSPEACGKRLERSRKHLGRATRQNPHTR